MILNQSHVVHDRKLAAFLLAQKLNEYRNSPAIVLAIPHGGVPVGYHIAQQLHLPFDVIACKKIKHPVDTKRTIGSVSIDDVTIHDVSGVPNDYIYHQVLLNKNILKTQCAYFNPQAKPLMIKGRTVILVDDFLTTIDTVMASVRTIKKQNPLRIIFAVPVAARGAYNQLSSEVDEVVLLSMEPENKVLEFYADHTPVCDEEVRDLVARANAEFN